MISVGDRVHHKCEYPDCPIYGKVVAVQLLNIRTNYEATHLIIPESESRPWALVEWEATTGQGVDKDIPFGFKQWVPCERLEPA